MDVEDQGDLDDEDDEEYEEARDSLYEEADAASTNTDTRSGTERTHSHSNSHSHSHDRRHHPASMDGSGVDSHKHSRHDLHDVAPKDSRWRRRVEQALTKMTAEIAAVREQMELRTLAHRRRSGVWAWLKWILWTAFRQIVWDLALLGVILILMRVRGDRRLENRLRDGWKELKARLGRFKLLKRFGDAPLLP
jgi:hypothetical protein